MAKLLENQALHEAKVAPDFAAIQAAGLDELATGWCCWRYIQRPGGGKPGKAPHTPEGRRLSVDSPDAWANFGVAVLGYGAGGFAGIGLLMPSARGIVGLDLDACLSDGEVVQERAEIVADFLALGGYLEVSPSGTGLRQFLKGVRLEDFSSRGRDGLEIYDEDDRRYLTVTGRTYPAGCDARPVIANQAALEAFIVKWGNQTTVGGQAPAGGGNSVGAAGGRTAAQVLALLKKHNRRGKVTRLLAGNTDDHDGDHSAADLALCCEVAYFSRDPSVIDGVIRGSGLMRPKWDEKRGKEAYGAITVNNALKKQDRNFDEDQAAKLAEEVRVTGEDSHLIGGGDDLRNRKGWRSDTWALTELLLRDRRLLGCVFFDEFSGFPILTRSMCEAFGDKSAPPTVGRFSDAHLQAVGRWFGKAWGLRVDVRSVSAAVAGWAQAVRRNPVRERLEELRGYWDGKSRIDDWLIKYCGAKTITDEGRDIGPYVSAIGARWLISVIARAMEPGCKVDSMLVLEGRQGACKSSAARALAEAIGPNYFREGFSLDSSGKDELIALRGRLVIEWGELSGLGKKDREHLKNFLSQQTDSYREVYGVTETDWPRTAVFIGTTNESSYLADVTGNRRFWPATVGRIG